MSFWHHTSVPWNKDDITDFAEELDRHRDTMIRGDRTRLSDECAQFLDTFMNGRLSDEQLDFFERQIASIAVRHLAEIHRER